MDEKELLDAVVQRFLIINAAEVENVFLISCNYTPVDVGVHDLSYLVKYEVDVCCNYNVRCILLPYQMCCCWNQTMCLNNGDFTEGKTVPFQVNVFPNYIFSILKYSRWCV